MLRSVRERSAGVKPRCRYEGEEMKAKIVEPSDAEALVVLGDHQSILLSASDTNGSALILEQYNEPGVAVPLHVHTNEDEVWYVVEGEVLFTVGNDRRVAKAGTTVFGPRGIPHATMVVGESPAKVILTVLPGNLEAMFRELSELGIAPQPNVVVGICARYGISFIEEM